MLVRFLLLCLLLMFVARALRRFLAGVLQGAATPPPRREPQQGVRMMRDPVCGTFVVPQRAITASDGGQVQYFCSEKCRDAYRLRASSR